MGPLRDCECGMAKILHNVKQCSTCEVADRMADEIATLTRERDEARAEVEQEAALWEKEVDVWRQRIFEAHEVLDKNKLAEHEHLLVDRLEVIIQDLHTTQRALSNAHERIEGLKQKNARLRAALRLAEGPIAIAASYADQPCETMGMRVHAKDCARILPEIRAALAGEGEVGPASCTCESLIPTCSTCDRCTCPPCALCDLGNVHMSCECFEPRCPRCMSGEGEDEARERAEKARQA